MGQIVRRKKKGRPSKADLARRSGQSPATTNSDLRRSRRRRNVRYNIIDYDDYLDEEDEDEEDEDERRREKKKLKLVEKLNQGADEEDDDEDEPVAPPTRGRPRVVHAHDEDVRKNEDGDEGDEGDEEGEEEVEEEEGIEDVEDDEGETERGEVCEGIQI